jgi:hypothetical protein
MFKQRRDFLRFLMKVSALLAQSVSSIPAFAGSIIGASTSPVFERYVGRAILPGEDSTLLIVGSNILSVQSVIFRNRQITATILEHDDSHLMLRIHTTARWRPGAREMRVRTVDGVVMPVPIALVADKTGQRLAGTYGPYGYYDTYSGYGPYRPLQV